MQTLGDLFPPELKSSKRIHEEVKKDFEPIYEIGQEVWHRGKWRKITAIDSGGNMFAGVMLIPINQPSKRQQLSQ